MVVVIAILWFILFASLHLTFTLVTTNLKARLESVKFLFYNFWPLLALCSFMCVNRLHVQCVFTCRSVVSVSLASESVMMKTPSTERPPGSILDT